MCNSIILPAAAPGVVQSPDLPRPTIHPAALSRRRLGIARQPPVMRGTDEGVSLVHFSAQPEPVSSLIDRRHQPYPTKSAHVELKHWTSVSPWHRCLHRVDGGQPRVVAQLVSTNIRQRPGAEFCAPAAPRAGPGRCCSPRQSRKPRVPTPYGMNVLNSKP